MLPQTKGRQPHGFDKPVEVHLHPGLVTVAHRIDHASILGFLAHDRPGRGIQFGIHRHEMFAARISRQRHLGAIGDGAGQFEDDIHLIGLTEQGCNRW